MLLQVSVFMGICHSHSTRLRRVNGNLLIGFRSRKCRSMTIVIIPQFYKDCQVFFLTQHISRYYIPNLKDWDVVAEDQIN